MLQSNKYNHSPGIKIYPAHNFPFKYRDGKDIRTNPEGLADGQANYDKGVLRQNGGTTYCVLCIRIA